MKPIEVYVSSSTKLDYTNYEQEQLDRFNAPNALVEIGKTSLSGSQIYGVGI
jgi:hypothetical protein